MEALERSGNGQLQGIDGEQPMDEQTQRVLDAIEKRFAIHLDTRLQPVEVRQMEILKELRERGKEVQALTTEKAILEHRLQQAEEDLEKGFESIRNEMRRKYEALQEETRRSRWLEPTVKAVAGLTVTLIGLLTYWIARAS